MDFRKLEEKVIYSGFFTLTKYKIEFEKYNGDKGIKDVEVFERGDSIGIVLFEKDTNSLLFTEQFRYPITKYESGWIIELVAGKIDDGESAVDSTKREIEEEIGYKVTEMEEIGTYYLSPGGTTERITIFYAEVNSNDKTLKGGGKLDESEDIKLIKIKLEEIEDKIKLGFFKDAKTIIGINWFQMNKLTKK